MNALVGLPADAWGKRSKDQKHERLCPECLRMFTPTKHRKKFCSLNCEEQYLGEK